MLCCFTYPLLPHRFRHTNGRLYLRFTALLMLFTTALRAAVTWNAMKGSQSAQPRHLHLRRRLLACSQYCISKKKRGGGAGGATSMAQGRAT
jgi:hypothetical protein